MWPIASPLGLLKQPLQGTGVRLDLPVFSFPPRPIFAHVLSHLLNVRLHVDVVGLGVLWVSCCRANILYVAGLAQSPQLVIVDPKASLRKGFLYIVGLDAVPILPLQVAYAFPSLRGVSFFLVLFVAGLPDLSAV